MRPLAPCRAHSIAHARPIPRDAPVMQMTLFASNAMFVSSCVRRPVSRLNVGILRLAITVELSYSGPRSVYLLYPAGSRAAPIVCDDRFALSRRGAKRGMWGRADGCLVPASQGHARGPPLAMLTTRASHRDRGTAVTPHPSRRGGTLSIRRPARFHD